MFGLKYAAVFVVDEVDRYIRLLNLNDKAEPLVVALDQEGVWTYRVVSTPLTLTVRGGKVCA